MAVRLQSQGAMPSSCSEPGRRFAEGELGMAAAQAGPLQAPSRSPSTSSPAARSSPRRPTRCTCRPARRAGPGDPRTRGPGASPPRRLPRVHALEFPLDLGAEPVRWHGQFFSGICNVIFCTQAANYGPTYDLMAEARKRHPRAWSYQRDFWLTGTEYRPPSFFPPTFPTSSASARRGGSPRWSRARAASCSASRTSSATSSTASRPAGPWPRIITRATRCSIADGVHDARTKVLAVDGAAGTVTVGPDRDPARRVEDRLRRAAPRSGGPRRAGAVPPGRVLPPQVQAPRHAVLLLGPARQGVGPGPPPVRPPPDGQLRRCPRRPGPRRPELDHRQGLCPVARGRPHDRRPRDRPLRRRLRSASPGASSTSPTWVRSSGGPTGTSSRSSTTTRPTPSCGPSRTAATTRTRSSSAAWSWAASSART